MNQYPLIVGIGELLWDNLPSGKRAGGAPINAVYHASCFGAKGYVISAVGKDELGEELLGVISKTDLHTIIEKVEYPTGTVNIILDDGIPEYNIIENVAWDYIPLTDNMLKIIKKANAVCYGTLASRNEISHNTTINLLKNANPSSFKLFDINLRSLYYSKKLVIELMDYANIFKMNSDEVKVLKDMFNVDISDDDLCNMIMEQYNLKYLIYTNGNLNSSVYYKGKVSKIDTPSVEVNDTIGAGDAFAGAFLYFLLMGLSVEEAHHKAVNISAFVCTQSGAWSKYPRIMENYI